MTKFYQNMVEIYSLDNYEILIEFRDYMTIT